MVVGSKSAPFGHTRIPPSWSSLDEAPLRRRKAATEALDRIHRKDRSVVLIVRVKMRAMMGLALLGEHSNDDPEDSVIR